MSTAVFVFVKQGSRKEGAGMNDEGPPQELGMTGGIAPEAQLKSLCPHASLRLQGPLARDRGSRPSQDSNGFGCQWRARVPFIFN